MSRGPAEVFSIATRLGAHPYEIEVAAADGRPIRTSSGLELVPHRALSPVRGGLDTLIVPGGEGTRPALRDATLVGWIARTARTARRVASVCTSAFLLAEAGLLDGHRATTHWSARAALSRRYRRSPSKRIRSSPCRGTCGRRLV